jgi:hypothetical protein
MKAIAFHPEGDWIETGDREDFRKNSSRNEFGPREGTPVESK